MNARGVDGAGCVGRSTTTNEMAEFYTLVDLKNVKGLKRVREESDEEAAVTKVEKKPAEEKLAEEKPAEEKPAEEKLAEEKPAVAVEEEREKRARKTEESDREQMRTILTTLITAGSETSAYKDAEKQLERVVCRLKKEGRL